MLGLSPVSGAPFYHPSLVWRLHCILVSAASAAVFTTVAVLRLVPAVSAATAGRGYKARTEENFTIIILLMDGIMTIIFAVSSLLLLVGTLRKVTRQYEIWRQVSWTLIFRHEVAF